MAGRGGGPSRRSHTKSRKGCKTCKRRHIRCDETFPQCRNCTKHQVRCDYMDMPPIVDDNLRINTQVNLHWTPAIEHAVDQWHTTDTSPFVDLDIFPLPQAKSLTRNELRLLYHILATLRELKNSHTSKLALWTDILPKCIVVAADHRCAMDALLSFSASHLAYETQSHETRAVATDYANMAARELRDAVGNFSKSNADAIFSASLLLSWLQNDWQNWSAAMSSLKTVIQAMQRFRPETVFEDYLAKQPLDPLQTFDEDSRFNITADVRQNHLKTIQTVQTALHHATTSVQLPAEDAKYVEQISSLMEALKNCPPPQLPREQFNQLYHFRKLLFWLPVSVLSTRRGDIHSLLLLSHFYAAALALETVFPDVCAPFLASLAAQPLTDIIEIIQTCQARQQYDNLAQAAAVLMDFPREALAAFRNRREWAQQQLAVNTPPQQQFTPEMINIELAMQLADQQVHTPSLSPAFASTTINLTTTPLSHHSARSPFLEVPGSAAVDQFPYKPYTPTSGSFHGTPTSAYTPSPLISPGFRPGGEDGFQMALPEYQVTRAEHDYTSVLSPLTPYPMSPAGSMYHGASGGAGGCVVPTAVWT